MHQLPNEAVTHNGRFHADDVFSAALLKILNPEIHISRVSTVPENFDGIVFDLANGAFDHHNSNKKCRENGVPYASFGLLWNEYGHTLVSESAAKTFDESFIQPLDTQDNYGGNNMLCRAITQANPKWDSVYDSLSCPQLDSFHCPITAYIRVQGSVLVIRDVTPRIISHSLNNSLKFFQRVCDGSSIFVSKGFIPSHNRFVIPEDIIQIGQFTAHTPVGNTQKHSVAL